MVRRAYNTGDRPVPEFELAQFLGRGGFGEVWEAKGPGGVMMAVKIIHDLNSRKGAMELRALRLMRQIRHPNLVSINAFWLKNRRGEVLNEEALQESVLAKHSSKAKGASTLADEDDQSSPDELVISMGLCDRNLLDRLHECQREGGWGIPVLELLSYMDDASKAIDLLNTRYSIQHCDIKPQNILVVGGGAQVCDFGLATSIGDLRETLNGAMSIPYAAPEVFGKRGPSDRTDQYSLAISYVELRTGELPFHDTNSIVAILDAKATGKLDLSRLVAGERDVIARAVAPRPEARFASTRELVRALKNCQEGSVSILPAPPTTRTPYDGGSHANETPPPSTSSTFPPRIDNALSPTTGSATGQASREPRSSTTGGASTAGAAAAGSPPVGMPNDKPSVRSSTYSGDEPVPGHTKIRPLMRQTSEEIWEGRAPGQKPVAMVIRDLNRATSADLRALAMIPTLSHENLSEPQSCWLIDSQGEVIADDVYTTQPPPELSRLVIVGKKVRNTLQDQLSDVRVRTGRGMPRTTVIDNLEPIAKAIDHLNTRNHECNGRRVGVVHCNVSPDSMLVDGETVKIGNLSWSTVVESDSDPYEPSLHNPDQVFPAPELLSGRVTRWTDQYSLAVSYVEMRSPRPQEGPEIDVSSLSDEERKVIRRALSDEPEQRFEDCEQFVAALRQAARTTRKPRTAGDSRPGANRRKASGATKPKVHPSAQGRQLAGWLKWAIAAGLTLVVLAVVGWQFDRRLQDDVNTRLKHGRYSEAHDKLQEGWINPLLPSADGLEAEVSGAWYEHIDSLQARGEFSEARAQLTDFMEAYPNQSQAKQLNLKLSVRIVELFNLVAGGRDRMHEDFQGGQPKDAVSRASNALHYVEALDVFDLIDSMRNEVNDLRCQLLLGQARAQAQHEPPNWLEVQRDLNDLSRASMPTSAPYSASRAALECALAVLASDADPNADPNETLKLQGVYEHAAKKAKNDAVRDNPWRLTDDEQARLAAVGKHTQ